MVFVNIAGMNRTIFTYVVGFFCGLATGISLCIFTPVVNSNIEEQSTNSVVVATSISETNRVGTTHNVDWFKDSSNYIWDGWKIK